MPDDMYDALKRDLDNIDAGMMGPADAAAVAVDTYRLARDGETEAAEPWKELQERAKAILSDIIAETGKSEWAGKTARAYIPAPGVTVTYDSRALDALCASDPELARYLMPHRKERERPGSLTVR